MAEEKETKAKIKKPKSDVVGHLAEPVPLDKTVKLDADITQVLSDHLIMAGLSGKIDAQEIEKFTSISNTRDTQYNQLDTMCGDSSVSAVVRTIAEDVCEVADNGHIMWAESQDPKISKHINYLLNVANVDKSAYKWVYSLLKYGDVYLKLLRESDYEDQLFSGETINKVRNARLNESIDESIYLNMKRPGDRYSYQLEMIPNPSTMFELTKHDVTCGFIETPDNNYSIGESSMFMDSAALGQAGSVSTVGAYNYRMKSNDVIVHQADAFVHACLEDNLSRYPETVDMFLPDDDTKAQDTKKDLEKNGSLVKYTVRRGKSILYDAYKIWREKQLLEGAVLLARLTRSSVYRKVGVEMGNTSREKSAQILRSVKDMFEQKSSYNTGVGMSEYTNPGAVENFIYHATRNGKGAITVETIGGDYDPKSLVDLDTWNTKFYSAFGIPKQYFGWTEDGAGFNGGTALTILSSVYGKSVKRVQNALIQAITQAINLFLYESGLLSYTNNFVLKMKFPLTQEEKDYRENLSNRVNAISSINSLFTDVETRSTRLSMLRDLVSTLNLGDDLIAKLGDEIKKAVAEEEKAKAEAEKAEEEAANEVATAGGEADSAPAPSGGGSAGKGEDLNLDLDTKGGSAAGGEDLNLDLSSLPTAPDTPTESFTNNGGSMSLTEDTEFLDEDVDLPNPDELEDIDFSKNK